MLAFHWEYWFAVKQAIFIELDSLCCNFPCPEWLSGVSFGQKKQLKESKELKSEDKLNNLFVHSYTLHYLQISCCHISGYVTRKLPLCMLCCIHFLYCREWRHTEAEASVICFYFFICSILCFLTLSRILSGLDPKCREWQNHRDLPTFSAKPKYVVFIFYQEF